MCDIQGEEGWITNRNPNYAFWEYGRCLRPFSLALRFLFFSSWARERIKLTLTCRAKPRSASRPPTSRLSRILSSRAMLYSFYLYAYAFTYHHHLPPSPNATVAYKEETHTHTRTLTHKNWTSTKSETNMYIASKAQRDMQWRLFFRRVALIRAQDAIYIKYTLYMYCKTAIHLCRPIAFRSTTYSIVVEHYVCHHIHHHSLTPSLVLGAHPPPAAAVDKPPPPPTHSTFIFISQFHHLTLAAVFLFQLQIVSIYYVSVCVYVCVCVCVCVYTFVGAASDRLRSRVIKLMFWSNIETVNESWA